MLAPCRVNEANKSVEIRKPKMKFNINSGSIYYYPDYSKKYEIIILTNRYLESING